MPSVTLSGRAFLRLSGKDAETFLQSLITTNLPDLPEGEIRPGALLTPQGKILFDFLIRRDGAEAFLIETTEDQRDALLKRLTMYRLRAAVDLAVAEGGDAATGGPAGRPRLREALRPAGRVVAGVEQALPL